MQGHNYRNYLSEIRIDPLFTMVKPPLAITETHLRR